MSSGSIIAISGTLKGDKKQIHCWKRSVTVNPFAAV